MTPITTKAKSNCKKCYGTGKITLTWPLGRGRMRKATVPCKCVKNIIEKKDLVKEELELDPDNQAPVVVEEKDK